jgi:hypothetical protein
MLAPSGGLEPPRTQGGDQILQHPAHPATGNGAQALKPERGRIARRPGKPRSSRACRARDRSGRLGQDVPGVEADRFDVAPKP